MFTARASIIGALINAFEWYEYAIYGYFATIIGKLFFPSNDPVISLLATFAVFATGFAMRPIGAIIFGHIGDRYGRKRALMLSLWFMAVPTALIGLLPTYHNIGISASFILLLVRLLQGLAVGGNYGGSFIYAIEHAPKRHQGFAGSWGEFGALGGLLLGSLTGYAFSHYMPEGVLYTYGWRFPFLLGIITTMLAWHLRRYIPETPNFESSDKIQPLKMILKNHKMQVLKGMILVLPDAVGIYILFLYLISYMQMILGFSLDQALLINTLSMLIMVPSILIFGHVSDLIGQRKILWWVSIGFIVLPLPLLSIINYGNLYVLLFSQIVFALLMAACYGALPTFVVKYFPKEIRYSACGLTFNLCVAIFGGTAPIVSTWLVDTFKSPVGLALYLMLVGILNFIVLGKNDTKRITHMEN